MGQQKIKEQINLKYECEGGYQRIFGESFARENWENIELIINGEEIDLIDVYELEKGENIITLIIKKRIKNLSHMFEDCKIIKKY